MSNRKIQIALAVLALFSVVIGAVLYRSLRAEKNTVELQAQQLLDRKGEFNGQTTEAQVAELKEALLFLAQEVGNVKSSEAQSTTDSSSYSRVSSPSLSGSLNSGSADLLIRIKSLEDKLTSLEQKVAALPTPSPQSTSAKSAQYIPLGVDGDTTDRNGTTLSNFEISLDPADFPGYTSMQLEVVMKLTEQVGTLSTSLYDYTDNDIIDYSEATTTSTNYATKTSSTFKLPATRRNYRLFAKSSEGYLGYIQSARLKVNY